MKNVVNFINEFTSYGKRKEIVDVLGKEYDYWFSLILFRKFIRENSTIMYDSKRDHFGTMIHGKVYDVTGDVTSKYEWIPWNNIHNKDSIITRI